jgi:LytS/YehU family sensor histidine kinase
MKALRTQMNPHFIFNSLNAINLFILENNRVRASEYLAKFSKLIRMILQNSQLAVIDLDTELESLELYLSLEILRFDYHFTYTISIQDDLDISSLKVPPLIIQPYVENAIWHGLMHKEEKGELGIEIYQESDFLFIKIVDDGIGRNRAAALAIKSHAKHKSMGLDITSKRISIVQGPYKGEFPVMIKDLVNAEGEPTGTEVIIKIPISYD